LIFVLVFVSRDLELGDAPAVSPSTKSFSDFNDIWCVSVIDFYLEVDH